MGCRQSTPVEAPTSAAPANTSAPPSQTSSAPVTNAPVSGAPVSAASASAVSGAPASAPKSTGAPVPEPVAEAPKSKSSSVEAVAPPSSKTLQRFAITGYSIVDSGVVYYTISLADGEADANVQKRFKEFKTLYQALVKKQGGAQLPALPDSGLRSVIKGRHNTDLLKAREVQLAAVLNAIAERPDLSSSSEFRHFVAPASA